MLCAILSDVNPSLYTPKKRVRSLCAEKKLLSRQITSTTALRPLPLTQPEKIWLKYLCKNCNNITATMCAYTQRATCNNINIDDDNKSNNNLSNMYLCGVQKIQIKSFIFLIYFCCILFYILFYSICFRLSLTTTPIFHFLALSLAVFFLLFKSGPYQCTQFTHIFFLDLQKEHAELTICSYFRFEKE